MIWPTVSSWSCFWWLYRASPSSAAKNIISLISVVTIGWCACIVFPCVVRRRCLLWPVHSLGKTLLAFALLHFVLQSQVQFSSVQSISRVRLFVTPWIAARQASLSITNSQSSLRRTSIKSMLPSSHLILGRPLLFLPPILPASESFPMSQLFTWDGQSTGVSAVSSFLPKKSQGWSPLEWTYWISLQSKGLSRVFSNTAVQKHQFFGAQLSSQSNSHIHTLPLEKP